MKNSKLLKRHAFILDILCLLLCFVLLYLGTTNKLPCEENRRIEREILENAAKEDAVDKAIEEGEIVDEQDEYKNDDEQ